MIRSRSWYLLPLGDSAGLTLVFANDHRTRLHYVVFEEQGKFELQGNVATFDGPVTQGRITAHFDGDTPRIVELSGTVDMSLIKADDLVAPPDEMTTSSFWSTQDYKRRALIATANQPIDTSSASDMDRDGLRAMFGIRDDVERRIARARGFFHRLERLSRLDQAIPGHEQIYRILDGRIDMRAAYGKAKLVAKIPRLDEDEVTTAIDISSFLRTLLLAEAREDLPWTLELFATERLAAEHPGKHARVLDHQGVPNGADFFKFTEFALLAIQHGIHDSFWSKVLVHFVRASQVYAEHAYIGSGLFAYDENRPPYPLARIGELRLAYPNDCPSSVLEERFTSILGQRLEPFFVARDGEPLKHHVTFPKPRVSNDLVQRFLAML